MYNGLRSSTVDHQTLQIVIFFVFNLLCTVSCISNNGTCNFTNDFCDYVETKSNSELYWHRSNASYIASPQMLKEQFVRLTSPTISIEKGHCVTFSYRIRPGKLFTHPNIDTNNSKLVQNADIQLKVFVLHESNSETFHQEVWTNPIGQSKNWKQVEIALSPSSYKLMFEVSGLGNGLSGLVVDINNIELSKNLCDVTPLFLKLGSKEANIGENITMECLLSVDYNFNTSLDQISVSLEKAEFSPNKKPSKIRSDGYHYFFDFQFDNLNFHTKGSYRCVYKSKQVVAISNSADIIVSIPPVPTTAPQILQLGPDSVELNLNNNQYSGDGPLVRSYLHYRRKGLNWFQSHEMKGRTYQLWHLTPDTTYIFAVSLERPGIGGRGTMGPELELKTKCMSPSRPVSHVTTSSPTYDSVQVKWKQLDFSEINCHAFKYKLKYRQQFTDIKNKSEKFKSIDANLDGDAFIKSLLPYTTYEIRIVTINEAGQIESTSFYQRTQESVPGPIPKDTFQVTNVDETSISLRWEKPEKENGFLRNYQISYQATSSHDPSFNVKYEKAHIERSFPDRSINLTSLKPGTTHNITICAETLVGCGPIVSLQVDTHIAPPTMPQYPPLNNKTNQTNPTVEVILRPAYSNGAPVTNYYLVIEDITDEMEENSRRRRSVLASKITTTESEMNEAGSTAPSGGDKSTCVNISPLDYKQAKAMNKSSFVAASFSPEQLNKERKFVVGDGSKHNGFTNIALNPKRNYRIYLVAESKVGDEVRSGCVVLLQTDAVVAKDTSAETNTESEKSTGGTAFVLYGGIGGAILVIVLISVVLLVLIRAHRKKKNPQKDEVVNPFEVRLMLSDIPQNVSSNNSHLMNSTLPIQSSYNSNVAGYRDPDFNEKNMEATCASSVGDAENEKFAIRVNDFHLHVSQMKSADGYGFREEFSLFPEGPTASWNVALSSINKKKNRYGNIMAYDHSRVVLEPVPGFDTALTTNYINASYINGYKCPPSYIATQAPTSDTCVDFWLMVWQENVNVVVMLTNLMELGKRKCEKYWPDDRGQYGPFEVSMNREEFTCDYVMRTFLLRQVGEYDVREVRQFHFSAWPDHGVPSRPTNLLTFIRRVKAFEPPDGSTIVHCSAGSGRTGCYITIDQMLQMAREEEIVDVYNTVRHLRTKRVDMVQTELQYIFIHEALLEALICGETSVQPDQLGNHYDEIITMDAMSNLAPIQEEFDTLNLITPKLSDEECAVARLPRNRDYNRFNDVLPADRHLAYLLSPDLTDRNNTYINAVFADSYSRKNAFLITQMPLPNTVVDIWRLIYDHQCTSIVMMNDLSEHDETCAIYWPETASVTSGQFTIELMNKEDEIDVVTRVFKIQNNSDPNEGVRYVKQFQLTNWPGPQPVPFSRNAVLRVIQLTMKWQSECERNGYHGRTVVHCVAGAGRSGTFVACYNMCEQMSSEYSADIFNNVQRLRNIRSHLVETLEQYRFCYEVGIEFADQ